jgi:hypothetical protein|tara:strand:- start:1369 stop:1470 length:102 start_codon:yes stop_codon:yes gene_type:complete
VGVRLQWKLKSALVLQRKVQAVLHYSLRMTLKQ